jgi:hypothetical protein
VVQRVAPEPSVETTPEPAQTTPSSTSSLRQPPPVRRGPGTPPPPLCGQTVCPSK